MRIGRSFLLGLAVMALLPAASAVADETPAPTAPSQQPQFVVYCYDQARDVVSRKLAADCHGAIVSEAKAREVEERRSQQIAKALKAGAPTAAGGARIASIGTAFFVDGAGTLLTNNHVIDGCAAVTVETADGDSLPAKVAAVDVARDLALLQVQVRSPAIAAFRSQPLSEAGAPVTAVGFPDQGLPPREPIATPGALLMPPPGRSWGDRIVIEADIRHGDSGGPVLDRYGLVAGVIQAKVNQVAEYRATGKTGKDIGIGIATPIVLDFLHSHGVKFQLLQQGEQLNGAELLMTARAYIARADCWR